MEEYGVQYIKGMVGKIFPEDDKLLVHGVDSLTGETVIIDADLVVLAAATKANRCRGARPQARH